MADKAISELTPATGIGATDLFVLEQAGTAKKLTGQILENWLVSYADGHGGIQSLTKTSSTGTNPVIDTYTITYADATTSTFTVTNGLKGDKGNQTYVWIKYAAQYPTADSQMGNSPDDWIGIYVGTASTAPTTRTSYTWFQWKGETGDPASLNTSAITYQASNNGTTVPSGTWVNTVPYVTPGNYLWTRIILGFNTGNPVTFYTVSRYGVDGQGAAGTAVPLSDTTNGSVGTSTSFSREDHQHPLPLASDILLNSGNSVEDKVSELLTFEGLYITGTIQSTAMYINDNRITADMRVVECVIGTPANVRTDLNWTTAAGRITFTGTVIAATTISLVLMKTN